MFTFLFGPSPGPVTGGRMMLDRACGSSIRTTLSLDTIFTLIFCPFSTQLHFTFLTTLSSCLSFLCFFHFMSYPTHEPTTRTQFDWLLPVTNTMIYFAINTPKQSSSPSTTRSCVLGFICSGLYPTLTVETSSTASDIRW